MPAICESIASKINENLSQSFKKTEKENFESHLTPTAKQVLSTKIEYEPVASYTNTILSSLQTKYIVLKANQSALTINGNTPKSQQNTTNGKHHSGGPSTSQTQLPQPKKTLFPRESVQVGWSNIGRNWSHGCGFHNVGNTCYLNSAIQAFFHVPAIANWLVSDKEHRDRGSCQNYQQCIICAMAQTLLNTQRQPHAITPSLITNRLHNICKHLTLGRQEDSHEFLRYLVEQMEKSFLFRFKNMSGFKELDQYSKETTALNQILGGYLRSTVTCLACKHESITFQHFMDLPLDISRVSTLNEALGGYFARENLEECGYKCESCKKKVSATKRFSLERVPAVLCIQLKRFNVMGGKLSKPIQISQNLDLQKHLAKSGDPNQSCFYKLVSLVTHIGGSASGGHYTAIGLAPNGNYYQFDDSCVSTVSTDHVLRTNAYVLFYELVHKQKPIVNGQNHMSEHTYSKMATSTATSSSISSREGFAKPKLPMLPTTIIRQNNILKQKENETTPPSSKLSSVSKNGVNGNGLAKVTTQLFPAVKLNGKREASDDEGEKEGEVVAKKMKPSLPRLTSEEQPAPLTPSTSSASSSPATPTKPKSLVPYETDDEDDEPPVKLCKTSSGVFVVSDLKDNITPSKQGSTIVTKASLANGTAKPATNGNLVKRTDDTFQQLTKLNHCGYGTNDVVKWDNTPATMAREVDRDQQEERKRQLEDEEELEMDSGRVKKVKHNGNRYQSPQGKLPNPFQEQQNAQNGGGRPQSYFDRDRPYNNYNRPYQNGQQSFNRQQHFNGNSKFKGNGFKNGYGSGYQGNNNNNNHNRHHNGNGKFNNKRFYGNQRR